MRFQLLLPLVALTSAIVVPDEVVFNSLEVEDHHKPASLLESASDVKEKAFDYVRGTYKKMSKCAERTFDSMVEEFEGDAAVVHDKLEEEYFAASEWVASVLEAQADDGHDLDDDHPHPHPHPPHHGPPHHGPPHHGPGHRRPHPPPHHGKPNRTIYQLISDSKYTTKLAALINDDEDLVKVLNSTKANFTIFAPTDRAFSKIPEHAPKPDKKTIRKILAYHVVPGVYPAGRVLYEKTFPTLFKEEALGGEPQRLSAQVGLRGVTVNFYSRVVAVDIFATNGVIHGVDSLILPPPESIKILELLPGEFSTLLLGLGKTGLLNKTGEDGHIGGTFFAPSNDAFRKLGPRINAFLFSDRGEKYLKALLLYHTSLNFTLYSNAFYNGTSKSNENVESKAYPYFHVDLPTLLDGRSLAVDIGRYGPFVEIKINAFARVAVPNGVAKDGVIHVPDNVLIPPRQLPGSAAQSMWNGYEMEIEELVERLEPYVAKETEETEMQWEF